MKAVLIITILAISEALGYYQLGAVQDTPEVAHAKAEHLAAVAQAKAHIGSSDRSWSENVISSWSGDNGHYEPQVKYHGPIALPPGYDKHGAPLPVLDTHEVAHARAAHLAELSKAGGAIYPSIGPDPYWSHSDEGNSGWSGQSSHYAPAATYTKYHGPIAYSPGYDKHGAPLPVLETEEVKHAKAAHFAAYHKAAAASASAGYYYQPYGGGHKWKRSIHESSWSGVGHYAPQVKYHGPIALPPGYDKHGAPLPVLDTHEVAHAKAAHLAELSKAGGAIYPAIHGYSSSISDGHDSWSEQESYGGQYDSGIGGYYSGVSGQYAPQLKYHGPIALPPGYDKHGAPLPVKDTPEVAALKAKHAHIYAETLAHRAASAGPIWGHHNHW